jgi:hypothetical protein
MNYDNRLYAYILWIESHGHKWVSCKCDIPSGEELDKLALRMKKVRVMK